MNKQLAMRIACERAASLLLVEADNSEGLTEEAENNNSTHPEKDAEKIAEALKQLAVLLMRKGRK